MDTIQQVVSETYSREADRILAALIGTVRDFELAEDALQDALLVALKERWSDRWHSPQSECVDHHHSPAQGYRSLAP